MKTPTATPDRPSLVRREAASFACHLAQAAVVALTCWSAGSPARTIAEHGVVEIKVVVLAHLIRIRAELGRDRRDG